ncbi:MLP-like protein 31 [Salvia splendens]|uniref:MLP-like protein 31 n=1 Tax=Salvia splendens TaxID=180675 RepID=UPI001C274CE6|nr:MLP-like protein 31 [Salvia splendens]
MASYPNKLIAQLAFKAGGHVFHQLASLNPRHFIKATPTHIQECKLHQGDYGVNGSVIEWSYTVGGETRASRHRQREEANLVEDARRRPLCALQGLGHNGPC